MPRCERPPSPKLCLLMLATLLTALPVGAAFGATAPDAELTMIVAAGQQHVEQFFGAAFTAPFDVRVYSSRAALDAQWRKDWNDPGLKSECWMVASGVARKLDLLSPAAWKEDACEHDPDNLPQLGKLIEHELVHVFHGQHNLKPDFDGLDDLAWLIEGLATFASGQLDPPRLERVKALIAAGQAPTRLADFWKGPEKYGLAGSMVACIDGKYGRKKLSGLLPYTDAAQILEALGVRESQLIEDWKAFATRP